MSPGGTPLPTCRVRGRAPVGVALLLVGLVLGGCAAASPPAPTTPPAQPAPADDPATLRVMTWNVRTADADPADWAPVIASLRPDVVGLQEICADEVGALADVLRREHGLDYAAVPGPVRPPGAEADAPINAALGPACGTGPDDVDFGLGLLSRLPVRDAGVTVFPPDRRDEQRGYLTARVDAAGAPVTVVTTHVGLEGVGAEQLRRLAAVAGGDAVVLGDLNVGPRAPELAPLRRALVSVDPQGRQTTTALGAIDHVFVRGLRVVGEPEAPDVAVSDHRPLLATLAR